MIRYFILFVFIGIAIICINPFTARRSLKFRLFLISGFVLISSFIFFVLLAILWNSSDSGEEKRQIKEEQENRQKHIVLKNDWNQTVYVFINFEYNDDEKQKIKSKIVDYYNKTDSILLDRNAEYTVLLPILKSETIEFPRSFSITVKDSLFKVIDTYKEQSFLSKSLSTPKIKTNDKKNSADFWELRLKKGED